MLFGAHLVEDPDPEATRFGLKREVPHSPAPTPFTQFLRSSRFAAAPAPAPAGQLFPVVQMPRVTDTSNLEFSLDKTLEGIYARERQEQLQLKTLQTKLKLTDEQAVATALDLWRGINQVNLEENILPTRQRADLILVKDSDHLVERIRLRRL